MHLYSCRAGALVSVVVAVGCSGERTLAQTPFNVGGVSFVDRAARGEITLGAFRGSLGVIDFDRDGWQDLFFNDLAGRPKRLFRNVASAETPGGRTFQDVSMASGIGSDADATARSFSGVVVFDYNNDGWDDIYSAGPAGDGAGILFRNNGNGTFSNVSLASNVRVSGINPLCASADDFDHDGDLDLLITSTNTAGRILILLVNNGDGTFTERADLLPPITFVGVTYAQGCTDYDQDGWTDALVLFNQGRPMLLRNVANPAGGRRFEDATSASGFTSVGPAPMGIAFGDVNNDGWIDVAITDAATGTYYENRNGVLQRVFPYSTFFGWGTVYVDANNDSWPDNYQAGSFGSAAVDWMLRNNGDGTFTDARTALNTTMLPSQYCAKMDFDNDGREDIITVNPLQSVSVYHNVSTEPNAWLKIKLTGRGGVNTNAAGAFVRVVSDVRTQVGEVALGTSYSSTDDQRLHFGLGGATVVNRIEVVWPRAGSVAQRKDVFTGPFSPNQLITLTPRPACSADFNSSGAADVGDVFEFVSAWFAGSPNADVDGNAGVSVQDVFVFLNAWFVGC